MAENTNETKVMSETVQEPTTTKKTRTKEEAKDNTELEELKTQNRLLQEQISAMMKMIANISGGQTETKLTTSLLDEVRVVHLVERDDGLSTHIELTNMTIDFHAFGEERTLDRRQAEELAGRYRRWFDKGIIAFGEGSEDLAKRFALKSVKEYDYMKSDFITKLGTLDVYKLEELYNKLGEGHKKFVIEYFKRKIIEKKPAFNNIHKIEMLNRVSEGAMSDILLDRQRDMLNGVSDK